jgi:hypothetical protein
LHDELQFDHPSDQGPQSVRFPGPAQQQPRPAAETDSMKKSLRLPSPALVISILALVIALSGTAIAAKRYLITNTKQISPAALKQLTKLAAKGVKQGAAGAAGASGAAGATGAAGASGAQGPAGPGAVVYWAVVDPSGALARSGSKSAAEITSSEPIGTGSYVVKFSADVSKCAYEAAIGNSAAENTENPGFATVAARSGEPHGVEVQTYGAFTAKPELQDKGFHLAVFC